VPHFLGHSYPVDVPFELACKGFFTYRELEGVVMSPCLMFSANAGGTSVWLSGPANLRFLKNWSQEL